MRNQAYPLIRETGVSRRVRAHLSNPSFLLLVGKWHTMLYRLKDGKLTLCGMAQVAPRQYSDDEGFSLRRGQGNIYGAGFIKESPRHETTRRFFWELHRMLEEASRRYPPVDAVYLAAPDYRMRDAMERLPDDMRRRVRVQLSANVTGIHPSDIAERIAEHIEAEEPVAPMSQEARRLLDKTEVIRASGSRLPTRTRR